MRLVTTPPRGRAPSLTFRADGHYLNLPIVDEAGALIGIVDVLKLTYATLEQVNTLHADAGGAADPAGGPLWGRFFSAAAQAGGDDDGDTESIVSGLHGSEAASSSQAPFQTPTRPGYHRGLDSGALDTPGSELFPGDSASVVNDDSSEVGGLNHNGRRAGPPAASSVGASQAASTAPQPIVDDGTYLFKFVAPGGTTHRFQARYESFEFLTDIVGGKLGSDPFFSSAASAPLDEGDADKVKAAAPQPDPSDFQLSYRDDDGDLVLITADGDVVDAVATAKKQGKDRVVLHVSGGATWKAALAAAAAQEAAAPPAAVAVTKKLVVVDEGDEADGASSSSQSKDTDADPDAAAAAPARRAASSRKAGSAGTDADLVAGVLPKEYLLPASIGFLGVVIATVFIASRAGGSAR